MTLYTPLLPAPAAVVAGFNLGSIVIRAIIHGQHYGMHA